MNAIIEYFRDTNQSYSECRHCGLDVDQDTTACPHCGGPTVTYHLDG